ncbi:pentatricopeptide repeat-containing protein At3g12770-like [Neltuma alba]|uniref:pentatricopeptide repeat-containing protein At3g12770-like n=1 Tax=Neltuma alba TaxID=207710 RepID=UPI0010A562F8|nr:pentatricopeptide repeat-containing protein At3g12770-like [Prosopis alba]
MLLHRTFTFPTSRYYTSATVFHSPLHLLDLLQLSIHHRSLKLAQQSHAQILALGFGQNAFLYTRLVSAYFTCGNLSSSRLVFDSISLKSIYLWNSLINGYAKHHDFDEAFALFHEMIRTNVVPDDYTLATLSKISAETEDLISGKLIHAKSVNIGFVSDVVLANSLMSMYCKCGELGEARKLFDEMAQRNLSSWNGIIAGCAASEDCVSHLDLWNYFRRMQNEGFKPNAYTIASVLPACGSNTGRWDYGMELHGFLVKNELELKMDLDVHMGSSLIDMYSRSNRVAYSRRVFDRMKCRNVYVWTAMIKSYVQNGAPEEAASLLHEMQVEGGIQPNKVTLVSVLPACSSLAGLTGGKQIHGFAIKMDLNHDVSLCNALIDMYSKCGSLSYARRVFDNGAFYKDSISWSSMISAYGLHGRGEDAVNMYYKMLQLGAKPDVITLVGVLSACSKSGLVDQGLSIYDSFITKYGMKPTAEICACVVDMLGRSGQLDEAMKFIREMPIEPSASVWGAVLSSSIMHGNSVTRDLAYRFLLELEPENPSNYISLSNLYASHRRWDVVAEMRTMMKERGLRKVPGCSWITISGKTCSFYVADKAHPSSSLIYEILDDLLSVMKGNGCLDIDILTEIS